MGSGGTAATSRRGPVTGFLALARDRCAAQSSRRYIMALTRPVQRALEDFRESVRDLSHPEDRKKAWSMFAFLEARGERPLYDDVKRWAVENRFSEDDAS